MSASIALRVRRSAFRVALAVGLLAVPAAMAGATTHSAASVGYGRGQAAAPARNPLVSVAGDIACGPNVDAYNGGDGTVTQCRQKYTSRLILHSDAVWTLGDHLYPTATLPLLTSVYADTWGRKKAVTYPTPGDHDIGKIAGIGYFTYFGRPRYYSYSLGGWRVFSLDSEIDHSAESNQVRWLRSKLADTHADCIAAYWGAPRWTSGPKAPGDASFAPFMHALWRARADMVLSGDSHNYERFAPQTPAGARAVGGMRQFVVGTGGRSLVGFPHVQRNSQVRMEVFGVLQLRLHDDSYNWRFVNEANHVLDSGFKRCH